jgi:hypothetical protein
MSQSEQDTQFEERSRQEFLKSIETLDGRTLSRLNQARQTALENMARAPARQLVMGWKPFAGMAVAGAIALLVFRGSEVPSTPEPGQLIDASDQTAAIELILSGESFEMLDDLDFYIWLGDAIATSDLEETSNGVG